MGAILMDLPVRYGAVWWRVSSAVVMQSLRRIPHATVSQQHRWKLQTQPYVIVFCTMFLGSWGNVVYVLCLPGNECTWKSKLRESSRTDSCCPLNWVSKLLVRAASRRFKPQPSPQVTDVFIWWLKGGLTTLRKIETSLNTKKLICILT